MNKYPVTSGVIPSPVKVVLYGPEGIGKSTFASRFPAPLFIDTEGSTKNLDVRRLPPPAHWGMLLDEVAAAAETPCRTLVLDTADWAERLCIRAVCARGRVQGIEDFGYGKGYTYLKEEFAKLLDALEQVVNTGRNVVVTAHAQLSKFEQPDERGAYDRWSMKTTKQVAPLLREWCDMLLFANYKTFVVMDGSGKNAKGKAQGGQRVLYTAHHPCWDAKNRFGLPEEAPFDYSVIAAVVPAGPVSAPARTQTAPAGQQTAPAPAAPPPVQNAPAPQTAPAQTAPTGPQTAPALSTGLPQAVPAPVAAVPQPVPASAPPVPAHASAVPQPVPAPMAPAPVASPAPAQCAPNPAAPAAPTAPAAAQNTTPTEPSAQPAPAPAAPAPHAPAMPPREAAPSAGAALDAALSALGVPDALRALMVQSGITDAQLRLAVFQKGAYPEDMPIRDYAPAFSETFLPEHWPEVLQAIAQDGDIPF